MRRPTALRSLGACIARCDLDIAELVSAPMAAGLATLVADERELGRHRHRHGRRHHRHGGVRRRASCCTPRNCRSAALHVTKDLARRRCPRRSTHAERLKTLFGNVQSSPDDEREMLPVPLVGEEEHQIAKVPRSMVVNIIRPRLEETFEYGEGPAGQFAA